MGKLPFAPWTLSRSGVAIDAGPFRIRTEAARSTEDPERRQIAQAIRALPEVVDALAVLVLCPELDLRGRDPQGYEQARDALVRAGVLES